MLECSMPSLKLLLKEGGVSCFYDIVVKVKELPTSEGKIIKQSYLSMQGHISKSGNKCIP